MNGRYLWCKALPMDIKVQYKNRPFTFWVMMFVSVFWVTFKLFCFQHLYFNFYGVPPVSLISIIYNLQSIYFFLHHTGLKLKALQSEAAYAQSLAWIIDLILGLCMWARAGQKILDSVVFFSQPWAVYKLRIYCYLSLSLSLTHALCQENAVVYSGLFLAFSLICISLKKKS